MPARLHKRVLDGERQIWRAWKVLKKQYKDHGETWSESGIEPTNVFGRIVYHAVLGMLAEDEDQPTVLSRSNPLVKDARHTFGTWELDTKRNPRTAFIYTSNGSAFGVYQRPRFRLYVGVHHYSWGRHWTSFSTFSEIVYQTLRKDQDYDRLVLESKGLAGSFTLHQPFNLWFQRDCLNTAEVFALTVFKDLPVDLKDKILQLIRDDEFNTTFGALDEVTDHSVVSDSDTF